MDYITVNPDNLELTLSESEPKSGFIIPTKHSVHDVLERNFYGLVYYGVLYPYIRDEDKAKAKPKSAYKLIDPDPWLIALAAIIWEGLIQGFTWDMLKLSVLKGIEFLRLKNLLAEESFPKNGWKKSKEKKKSDLEIGISWTEFSEDGEPLHKFFLGVKREYEKKSEEERELIKRHFDPKFSNTKKQSKGCGKTRQ